MQPFGREAFLHRLEEAGGEGIVPWVEEFLLDLDTPISLFRRLVGEGEGFLLESAERGERVGRYSFLGWDPLLIFTFGGEAGGPACAGPLVPALGGEPLPRHPLAALRHLLARVRAKGPEGEGLAPFLGGAVGYFGYDLARYLERLPAPPPGGLDLPVACFLLPRCVLALDHLTHRAQLAVYADARAGREGALAAAEAALSGIRERLRRSPDEREGEGGVSGWVAAPGEARWNQTPAEFCARVERAKEYIRAGEIFQVVLSQRFERPLAAPPLAVYRALRSLNPSPYMFFLRLPPCILVGSSPEMLVRVQGRRVETRPIAGTRPRGGDAEGDARLAAELLADEKERAEHVMLVDLGRNDVGRVSLPGSVRIDRMMAVEHYSHVMHLVSDVSGELAPGCDRFDALAGCFPAGTLSGAPKVRAMEIIDELEPDRRGPYGGVVAYFSFGENLDSCIAIRTVVIRDGRAYVQAGAGIVADSDPRREHEECLNKAGALLRALDLAEEGSL